jgi:hypothetical protein
MSPYLHIESTTVGSIDLDLRNAIGMHGPECPTLRLFLKLTLYPYRRLQGNPQPVTLLHLNGVFTIGNTRLGECHLTPNIYAENPEYPHHQNIEIPIQFDWFRVRRIEELRKGDVVANLNLTPVFAIHGEGGAIIRIFNRDTYELHMEIPQSQWTNKVLPGLGYGNIALIELPFPPQLAEPFQTGVKEIQRAIDHFVEGNPPEAIAACRNALQAVVDSKPTEKSAEESNSFPARVERFAKQHLGKQTRSKRELFMTTMKSLWTFTSISVHPDGDEFFTRDDAEFVIRQTVAIVGYAGRILS